MRKASDNVSGRQIAGVVLIIALLAGGLVVVRRYYQPPTQPSVDVGRSTVDAFLKNVREGKAGEAWDSSSVEFKSIEGRESFVRKAKSAAILGEPLQFGSTQDVKIQDSPRTEFLYTSTKSGKTVRVLVGYEAGEWKVDRLAF